MIYRYPSDEPEPKREQFDKVLQQVEELYALVLQGIPTSTHP